jgi:hypothetical protein
MAHNPESSIIPFAEAERRTSHVTSEDLDRLGRYLLAFFGDQLGVDLRQLPIATVRAFVARFFEIGGELGGRYLATRGADMSPEDWYYSGETDQIMDAAAFQAVCELLDARKS